MSSSTTEAPATHPGSAGASANQPAPPTRYTRRKGLIGLGVALFAIGGGGAYALAEQASDAVDVVAVAADVPRGQVIESSDLTTAAASPDPALDTIPASQLDQIVGQQAAADLTAGTLLPEGAVTEGSLPPAGQTVVGVAVTPPQMPSAAITPGDQVRVFNTPAAGDAPPSDTPDSIAATVVSVSGTTDTGHVIVNVLVDRDIAGDLIARVATERVGIALDSLADQDNNDGQNDGQGEGS